MSHSSGRVRVLWLAGLMLTAAGCDPAVSVPTGIPMAELRAQNRSPLEIVTFQSAGGLGDAVLGMALEQAEEDAAKSKDAPAGESVKVQPRSHKLTVSNVSNCPITSFECAFTYLAQDGQLVSSDKATPKTNYLADFGSAIGPGSTETLEVTLLVPENTTPQPAITMIIYEENGLKKIWKKPAADRE